MNSETNYSETSYQNMALETYVLEKNVEEYPFSSLTRYLLLSHYRKTGHAGFENFLKKTALYFNNHHWLQFQLSQIKNEAPEHPFINEPLFKTGTLVNQSHFAVATDEQITMQQNSGISIPEEEVFIPGPQNLGSHLENYYEKEAPGNGLNFTQYEEEFIPEIQTLGIHIHSMPATETYPGNENVYKEITDKDNIPVPHTLTLGIHLENIPVQELQYSNENKNDNIPHQEEIPNPGMESLKIHIKNIPVRLITGEDVAELEKPAAKESIAFEPLHTVDYFASQGIRITDEVLSTDKLGTQMKSFTEWLRSMKKLHPSKQAEENSIAEDIIQSSAEVSNIDTEILTEAMAEVLIKQNKKEKAVEMYTKLSLINPSKSAYFAAKIESIKSI